MKDVLIFRHQAGKRYFSPTSRKTQHHLAGSAQAQHEALQAARRRQQTPAFVSQYALREGVEATISQGVRAFGMRRSECTK